MAQYTKGIAGIWDDEGMILKAARKTREMGFTKFDAISAYPVHGMEEACGIKRSWIPYVTFVAGLVGLTAGLLLTWWTSAVNWAVNVGGKPFFSLPAFIPIMFELTVLFAALCSVGALFYICKIPRIDPPVIDPDLSSHKFAIFIPQNDTGYDEARIEKMFKELGALEVKKTEY
ncbi:DUF3341 domain-containing protein [Bdellovibrio sp. NC01]|uniref:DUF3341 domain-containing protein n=1 Tax=Bdellovibrio sp. NC01 TaxID=2220073 RepID=UPI0011588D20|nr:DUF3341 domain-containing protein [Bdellovibrio sp. NC01]QDK37444.1 DUF3341 domain-containing protein [Bdellovibrio sp. NC01]